jgi:hypothetical protein
MSRRCADIILGAVFVAAVLGGAALTSGGAPAKDIPMMALFSERVGDKITGDGGGFYFHQGTTLDVNNVSISGREGNFVMVVRASSGRYVNLDFGARVTPPEGPNLAECAKAYFLATPEIKVQTVYWLLRTYWKCKYITHDEPDGTTWTELIRSTTRRDQTMLNLTTMSPGETVAVSVEGWRFRAPDDTATELPIDESLDGYLMTGVQWDPDAPGSAGYLLVTATDWTGDGVTDWILRTIPGKIVIKSYDHADDILPNGDAFHMTCGYPCEYGGFQMPFELKIARK